MQRHLKATPPTLHLSVEEEAIALDEQSESVIDVETTSADIDRLGDIVVTMGDAQAVVSNTPEIKPIDEALVGAVGDMAVAGSDADPTELTANLVPGTSPSTEGFFSAAKDKITEIWNKIKEIMAKMWQHVRAFFGSRERGADKMIEDAKHVDTGMKDLYSRGFDTQAEFDQWLKDMADRDSRWTRPYQFRGSAGPLTLRSKVVPQQHLKAELEKLRAHARNVIEEVIDAGLEATHFLTDVAKRCAADPAKVREIANEDMAKKYHAIFDKLASKIGIGHGYSQVYLGGFEVEINHRPSKIAHRFNAKIPEFIAAHPIAQGEPELLEVQTINDANEVILKWAEYEKSTLTVNGIARASEAADALRKEIDHLDKARAQFESDSAKRVGELEGSSDEASAFAALWSVMHDNGISNTMSMLSHEARSLACLCAITLPRIIDQAALTFKAAGKWTVSSFDYLNDLAEEAEKLRLRQEDRKKNGRRTGF